MKTKITSILICVLLSSTFAHDFHRAKKIVHENRRSKHLSHFHLRDAAQPPQTCVWICEGGDEGNENGLQLVVNKTTSLVGIVNVTAKVALILDINANLVAVLNGTSGEVIIINIETGSGVYIGANESKYGWLISQESFEVYLNSLTSLQVIIDAKVGTSFTASSISPAVLEVLGKILSHLSSEIGLQIKGNLHLSLNILLKISSSLSGLLKGSLKGILQIVGNGLISLHGDLLWLVGVFEGLGSFFTEIGGGLEYLIKAGVELDIALLLRTSDGVELLVNLLLAIVARVDLSIAADLLNSLEKLLTLIVKLGGNVSSGVNGVLKVVVNIIALINGQSNLEILTTSLLEFAASGSTNVDISISIKGLITVVSSLHSSSNLSGFVSIVEHLQKGTLRVGNINISEIITILVRYSSSGIDLVVNVLLRLSSIIKVAVSIPHLILQLILSLNSAAGVELVEKLIPTLSIKVSVSGGIDLKALLKEINIGSALKYIATGDINGLLNSLPVINKIYTAISEAVNKLSNGSINLKALLSSHDAGSIAKEILSWFKSVISHSGSISSGGGVTIKGGISGEGNSGGAITIGYHLGGESTSPKETTGSPHFPHFPYKIGFHVKSGHNNKHNYA